MRRRAVRWGAAGMAAAVCCAWGVWFWSGPAIDGARAVEARIARPGTAGVAARVVARPAHQASIAIPIERQFGGSARVLRVEVDAVHVASGPRVLRYARLAEAGAAGDGVVLEVPEQSDVLGGVVHAIEHAGDGSEDVWVAADGGGLWRLDARLRPVARWRAPGPVTALAVAGATLLVGVDGRGVYHVDRSARASLAPPQLAFLNVAFRQLLVREGELMVATRASGIAVVDLAEGEVDFVPLAPNVSAFSFEGGVLLAHASGAAYRLLEVQGMRTARRAFQLGGARWPRAGSGGGQHWVTGERAVLGLRARADEVVEDLALGLPGHPSAVAFEAGEERLWAVDGSGLHTWQPPARGVRSRSLVSLPGELRGLHVHDGWAWTASGGRLWAFPLDGEGAGEGRAPWRGRMFDRPVGVTSVAGEGGLLATVRTGGVDLWAVGAGITLRKVSAIERAVDAVRMEEGLLLSLDREIVRVHDLRRPDRPVEVLAATPSQLGHSVAYGLAEERLLTLERGGMVAVRRLVLGQAPEVEARIGPFRASTSPLITGGALGMVGDLLVVATMGPSPTLHTFDVGAPDRPLELGLLDLQGPAVDLTIREGLAWVVLEGSGLSLVDLRTPALPAEIGRVELPDAVGDAAVYNQSWRLPSLAWQGARLWWSGEGLLSPDMAALERIGGPEPRPTRTPGHATATPAGSATAAAGSPTPGLETPSPTAVPTGGSEKVEGPCYLPILWVPLVR